MLIVNFALNSINISQLFDKQYNTTQTGIF